ncbi:hypothetical protein PanWU01x14_328580 [Parasponia andersonii]|uniref:Uncharacterized protein n=1 Tax=Parasponia andersonii TaxID=3476 RepID=A0A2P5AIQ8_PARAD|nr:hypothetical protein PanWU01x14_328580 [Parasponia andersonii]
MNPSPFGTHRSAHRCNRYYPTPNITVDSASIARIEPDGTGPDRISVPLGFVSHHPKPHLPPPSTGRYGAPAMEAVAELSLRETSPSEYLLFGWFVSSSSNSLDVVVAFARTEASLSGLESGLQGILHETNEKMPVSLQDKSQFSLLGHCTVDLGNNGKLSRVGVEEDDESNSSRNVFGKKFGHRISECHKVDGLEQDRQISMGNSCIQLVCYSCEKFGRDVFCIPKLHHIHWNGQIVSQCDVHFIFYETPTFGAHHFSLQSRSSFEQVKAPLRKPKWFEELHQKQPLCDMDAIILAVNCATAARMLFGRHLNPKRSVSWFLAFMWHLFAMSVASLSTLLYIVLQSLYSLLSYASSSWIYITSTKVFNTAGLNIRIRSSQILYWPLFLQDKGIR